jgi:hypothetical protein
MTFYPKGCNDPNPADGALQWTGSALQVRVGGAWVSVPSNPLTTVGDLIYGGGTGSTPTALPVGSATEVLHGGVTPTWSGIVEADLAGFTNLTTADSDSTKHGLCPKLSNVAGQYLNGVGNWVTPAGAVTSYTTQGFNLQTSVTLTHNFGQYPIVQVIDGAGLVIAPDTITHISDDAVTVTFVGATTGTIIASIGSPQAQSVVSVNNDYDVLLTDRIVKMTVAGKTATLPTAVGYSGREYIIDNASAGNVYVTGTQTIQGEATQTIPSDSAIAVYSDGAVWRIY